MKGMKKLVAIVLSVMMIAGSVCVFTGCGGGDASKFKNVDLSSFSSTDMNGDTVTQDIFKDYDVTMVNVFTSWCQYCVEEMPYLEEMHQNMASNVNIVGLCMDATDEKETVEGEIKDTGITYTVIMDNDQLHSILDDCLTGYPTTFFVDSKGQIISDVDPIFGAPGDNKKDIIAAYQDKIQEALDAVGAE